MCIYDVYTTPKDCRGVRATIGDTRLNSKNREGDRRERCLARCDDGRRTRRSADEAEPPPIPIRRKGLKGKGLPNKEGMFRIGKRLYQIQRRDFKVPDEKAGRLICTTPRAVADAGSVTP